MFEFFGLLTLSFSVMFVVAAIVTTLLLPNIGNSERILTCINGEVFQIDNTNCFKTKLIPTGLECPSCIK